MSTRSRKALFAVAGVLAGLATILFAAVFLAYPRQAAPPIKTVAITPARLERGKYLFEVVADCDGCHSLRDFKRFGGPVMPHGRGIGNVMPAEMELPGTISAPNITPDRETGLGKWTDGEKIRAIREGIGRDGRVLFPMMPYQAYRKMSDEDVESLVAYLNSLEPVRHAVPRSQVKFPVSLMVRFSPQPV